MSSRFWSAVTVAATAVLLSSCASFTVNSLPQPGNAYRDGYDIVVEFANVLNLPDRAKVVQDGTAVGVVTDIQVMKDHVDVTTRIGSGVSVPSNIHATLQQATVLGDTYVAFELPESGEVAAGIPPNGRVPVVQTTAPPQLEDTIARLANFVGSGSIQRAQDTIIRVNRLAPSRAGELREVVMRVAADLEGAADNMDLVDKWLDGVAGTVNAMYRHRAEYGNWFSPNGMLAFDRATVSSGYIGTVLPSVGSIYSGGFWLVPLLNSLADAMGSMQQGKWAFEREEPAWRKLFLNDFLPVDRYPAINITSIVGPDGRELSGNVQDVLRILGAAP